MFKLKTILIVKDTLPPIPPNVLALSMLVPHSCHSPRKNPSEKGIPLCMGLQLYVWLPQCPEWMEHACLSLSS